MRILVAGGPRCGKTTLARKLAGSGGPTPRSTDDLIGRLDWSASSEEVSRWMDMPGPWVIEGVAVARALRKWLDRHHRTEVPCELVYVSHAPKVSLNSGQASMLRGCVTVWSQVARELVQRGVRVESF